MEKDSFYIEFKNILTEMKIEYLKENYEKVISLFDEAMKTIDSATLKYSDKYLMVYRSMCKMYVLAKEKMGKDKFWIEEHKVKK